MNKKAKKKKGGKPCLFLLAGLLFGGAPAWAGTPDCFQVEMTGAADTFSTESLVRVFVTVKAHNANTDEIYVDCKDTPTTSTGFELGAGDSITFGDPASPLSASAVCAGIVGGGTQTVSVCEHKR